MRKTKLVDCNPSFRAWSGRDGVDATDAIAFDCPEGHEGCRYIIPFTPPLRWPSDPEVTGQRWQRAGDTLETLTLTPSIKGIAKYESRDAAIADGIKPEHVHPRMHCHFHGFVTNGEITFCGDSK